MKMAKGVVFALVLFLFSATAASAASSIQQMIDGATEGKTIEVPPGTYTEDIIINKSLKLKGKGVTLEGTVKITANNVRFESFTLRNYGVENDGDFVLYVLGDDVRIFNNTFFKTEDAVEIAVDGDNATIKGNVFNGVISTDSGMVNIRSDSDDAQIVDNQFIGGPGGQFGPLNIFTSERSEISVRKNTFKNVSDIAVFVGGRNEEGRILKFEKNKFLDIGEIFIANEPESLNGVMMDFIKAERKVEKSNPGSEVVYGFERKDVVLQGLIDSADRGDTIAVPSGIYTQNAVVNKSIALTGKNVTVNGKFHITSDNVTISGFAFRNGFNDEEPIIKIEAGNASILKNHFDTTQDQVEILIDGPNALIKENILYSAASIARSWGMILVTGQGNNTRITNNGFINSSSHGLGVPILLTALQNGQAIEIAENRFTSFPPPTVIVYGEGAVLVIRNNPQELRRVVINDRPQSLNGFTDLDAGARNIEETNPGATVVLDF